MAGDSMTWSRRTPLAAIIVAALLAGCGLAGCGLAGCGPVSGGAAIQPAGRPHPRDPSHRAA
ncbi:MAG: hypothetical protein ABSB76_18350 [Streptosporangiaceae bacterium]